MSFFYVDIFLVSHESFVASVMMIDLDLILEAVSKWQTKLRTLTLQIKYTLD